MAEAGVRADDDARARLLEFVVDPPLQTAALPGVGGRLRACVSDFRVVELPAYTPDDREDAHLMFTLRKRGLTTEDALAELARQLEIPRRDIGLAGLKDRHAITEQWVTVPAAAGAALARFEHPAITLGPARGHSNKLRRGHLRGNRFTIVLRELAVPPAEAIIRIARKLELLAAQGGLENLYGPQRFGHGGNNAARGLAQLASPRAARRRLKADLTTSAGQSALFNLYVLTRRERGLMRTILAGDILKKSDTGGMFESSDSALDQARLDRGELVITGPIFGSKTRSPGPETPALALEDAVLRRCEISRETLRMLGRKVPGTRRAITIPARPDAISLTTVPPSPAETGDDAAELGEGVQLEFLLPAGSYATQLLRELMGPPA
ncbi:MAG: tRNA pseudouridine(13) synthase TruD [Myxococcales bacterium]|nr:tRNA pseudouridine(13) synthase TruD [Myxococcales bacterium]MCB9752265.1 tRNA pseudouridine(13) synthase TruD [Myxococcales bacterium]